MRNPSWRPWSAIKAHRRATRRRRGGRCRRELEFLSTGLSACLVPSDEARAPVINQNGRRRRTDVGAACCIPASSSALFFFAMIHRMKFMLVLWNAITWYPCPERVELQKIAFAQGWEGDVCPVFVVMECAVSALARKGRYAIYHCSIGLL